VIVGDTTFDMEMGRSAGIRTLGVEWGYHRAEDLRAAGTDHVIGGFDALQTAVDAVLQAP
jgi:phosphoglycolate phosphatase